jgi:ankyrin repeat protein
VQFVQLLLSRDDIDVNKLNFERYDPLHMACQNGHVRLLLSCDDIDMKANGYGNVALHIACQNGQGFVAEELLNVNDIDMNTVGSSCARWTPLHSAR